MPQQRSIWDDVDALLAEPSPAETTSTQAQTSASVWNDVDQLLASPPIVPTRSTVTSSHGPGSTTIDVPSDLSPAEQDTVFRATAAERQRQALPSIDQIVPPPVPPRRGVPVDAHGVTDPASVRVSTPADPSTYGLRPDGTKKGNGFLGALQRPDGSVMSEYSIADSEQLKDAKGNYLDYPTLVPTLTADEVNALLTIKEGEPVPDSIKQKAEAFALQRKARGLPLFAQPGEQQPSLFPQFRRAAGTPQPAVPVQGRLGSAKTGGMATSTPGTMPVLDAPGEGLAQIGRGLPVVGRSMANGPTADVGGAAAAAGESLAGLVKPKLPTPSAKELKGGVSDVLEGIAKVSEPAMVAGGVMAPVSTAAAILAAGGAGMVAEQGVRAMGGSDEDARLAANIVQTAVGAYAGTKVHQGITKGGAAARAARASGELPVAGELGGETRPPGPVNAGSGATDAARAGRPVYEPTRDVSGTITGVKPADVWTQVDQVLDNPPPPAGPVDESGRDLGGFAGPERRGADQGPPQGITERRHTELLERAAANPHIEERHVEAAAAGKAAAAPETKPEIDLTGMGTAIADNLYRRIWDDVKAGKLGERPALAEQVVKAAHERGLVQSLDDVRHFANMSIDQAREFFAAPAEADHAVSEPGAVAGSVQRPPGAGDEGQGGPVGARDAGRVPEPAAAEGAAPAQGAPAGEGSPAAVGPTAPRVSADDIPRSLAQRAHAGTSWVPEERADQERRGYVDHMQHVWNTLQEIALDKPQAAELFEQYRQGYLSRYGAVLEARSRVVSANIAGPSNFPRRQMEKRGNVYEKRVGEFVEWQRKAMGRLMSTVNPQGSGRISADDADAVEQLRKKIADAEKQQQLMRDVNAIIRGGKKLTRNQVLEQLEARTGFSRGTTTKLLEADDLGRTGFADYQLTNNSANIRRMQERVTELERIKGTAERSATFEAGSFAGAAFPGGRVEESAADNRVQIFFAGKPEGPLRSKLKLNGFKWAPSVGAWQRQRTDNAVRAAEGILGVKLAAPAAAAEVPGELPEPTVPGLRVEEEPRPAKPAPPVQPKKVTGGWERLDQPPQSSAALESLAKSGPDLRAGLARHFREMAKRAERNGGLPVNGKRRSPEDLARWQRIAEAWTAAADKLHPESADSKLHQENAVSSTPSAGEPAIGARVKLSDGREATVRELVTAGKAGGKGTMRLRRRARVFVEGRGQKYEQFVDLDKLTTLEAPAHESPESLRPDETRPGTDEPGPDAEGRHPQGAERGGDHDEPVTDEPVPTDDQTLDTLTDQAVTAGWKGDRALLRAELASRLAFVREMDSELADAGRNPLVLLKAIRDLGGISIKRESGWKGELRWLAEGGDAQTGSTRKASFGRVNGISGVFNRAGKTFDDMLQSLQADGRFDHLQTLNDLFDEIDAASSAERPGELVDRFVASLGPDWWTKLPERLSPEAVEEPPAADEGDVSFNPEELERADRDANADMRAAGERIDARKKLARELAGSGDSVKLTMAGGRWALAGPDMSKPGRFRWTRFDDDGPSGHSETETLYQAVYDALTDGYEPVAAEPAVDKLDTGEEQRRLPVADKARQVGRADTTFKAPVQASGDDFNLSDGQEEPDKQEPLFMPAGKRPPVAAVGPGEKFALPKQRPLPVPRTKTALEKLGLRSKRPALPVREIQQKLTDLFRVPVGTRHFPQRALGIYKPDVSVVRLGTEEDLQVLGHEMGHHLDMAIMEGSSIFNRGPISKELQRVGAPTSLPSYDAKQKRQEGTAEFFRRWLTEPETLTSEAPLFSAAFQQFLDHADPKLVNGLYDIQEEVQRYLAQTPEQQARLHIDFKGGSGSVLATAQKIAAAAKTPESRARAVAYLSSQWMDDLAYLKLAEQALRNAEPVDVGQSAYVQARLARGYTGKAEGFLEHGVRDYDGKFLGRSFDDALAPVYRRLEDFALYAAARRAADLHKRGKASGFTTPQLQAVLDKYGKDETFNAALDGLREFHKAKREYLVASGILSPEAAAKMTKLEPNYVPFERVRDVVSASLGGRKIANRASPIKRIKGSGRRIVNPLETIVKNTHAEVNAAETNLAMRKLVRTLTGPGSGEWLEEIPEPQVMTRFNLQKLETDIRALLEDLGVEELPDGGTTLDDYLNTMVKVFTPRTFARGTERFVTVIDGGTLRWFEVHDDGLYDALTSIGPQGTEQVVRLFFRGARMLKSFATSTVGFIIRNPIKDQFAATIQSRAGYRPTDFLRGLAEYLKAGDKYQLFLTSGADQANLVAGDRDLLRKRLKQLGHGKLRKFVDDTVLNPLDGLRVLSAAGETATRLGEFMRTLDNEGEINHRSLQLAALNARDVTQDFQKAGRQVRAWNQYTAFFSARVGGYGRMWEAAKENPTGFVWKALLSITLPTLALWVLNHEDPEYNEIPAWERNYYWHLPLYLLDKNFDLATLQASPKSVVQQHGWIKIPKPFELGQMFGTSLEIFLDYLKGTDPNVASRMMDRSTAYQTAQQAIPTAVLPFVEVAANYDFFRDRAIVNPWQQDLAPELQYSRWTSETAKRLGELLDMSPAKIETIIYGYTAGVGQGTLMAVDPLMGGKKPAAGPGHWPGVGAIWRDKATSEAQSLQDLYTTKALLEGLTASVKEWRAMGKEARAQKAIAGAQRLAPYEQSVKRADAELKKWRTAANQVFDNPDLTPAQKREALDRLYLQMVNIARTALGRRPLDRP